MQLINNQSLIIKERFVSAANDPAGSTVIRPTGPQRNGAILVETRLGNITEIIE